VVVARLPSSIPATARVKAPEEIDALRASRVSAARSATIRPPMVWLDVVAAWDDDGVIWDR